MTRRALVVSNDHVGTSMAGPGIRSYRFATELAQQFDVTLVVPFATDLADGRIRIVHDNPWDPARMTERVRGFDLVVAQRLPVPTMRALARSATRTIYDLYAPLTLEQLALDARETTSSIRGSMGRLNNLTQEVVLATGNAFVCAGERQRDFWLGGLANAGRLDAELYRHDPSLRRLIDVVPFGIDPEPPTAGPALRGVVPGIGPDDRILLWPGGIWNWFDPLTVIRAVHELSSRRADLRLFFLGLRHPVPGVPGMPHAAMAEEAVALADELGLRDRVVFFNHGWVPYAERGRYFLEADLAVSAHFDDVETRFAFRTRLLDCLWAGLPVVTTRGDALGDLVVAAGAGRAAEFGDVHGWVEALESMLDDDAALQRAREAAGRLRASFEWSRVLEPLHRLADPSTAPPATDTLARTAAARYLSLRLRIGYEQHGMLGAARRLLGRAARR
ncbi:MAG: glycosyltransferase family 4 protein [Actinomycetota bacterium]|nr:glycosyltransferase family 4 protein [Actinomycetota bacterium]